MRIKVGNRWFDAEPGQPIMVQLTDKDRENIANMAPEATRYAVFANGGSLATPEEKLEWMSQ